MVPIRETWEQITKDMIKDSGSPVTDLNTKDGKSPFVREEIVENCSNFNHKDELGDERPDTVSQELSTKNEKEYHSPKTRLTGPTQIPDASLNISSGSPPVDVEVKPALPGSEGHQAEALEYVPKPPVLNGHPYIKVYTLENNVAKANDYTKFNFKNPTAHEFFYMFKEGVECVEVRFRSETLWIHDANAHGNYYPCKLSYNDFFDLLYVHMADLWIYYYSYKHGSWTLYKTGLIGRPSTFTQPPDRTIIYEPESPTDPGDSDLPRGNEVDKPSDIIFTFYKNIHDGRVEKSDYRVFERFNALTFYFEKGAKCVKVHYKDVEVWRHSVSEYQTNYPKYVEFNKARDRVDIVFNSEWYYGFVFNSATKKWELKSTRLAMKPGALRDMLKGVFNVNLTVSPSTLSFVSGMSVRTIRFFLSFASGFPSGLKTLIDKLYYSDMYWETLPAIIINPDHLCKLFDLIRGTSLVFAEARLHNLIGRPDLVLHIVKELKTVGFNVEELLKTLLLYPEKLKIMVDKMRDFGYALNVTQFKNLGKNPQILSYLNLNPVDVKVLGAHGAPEQTVRGTLHVPNKEPEPAGGGASPGPGSAPDEVGNKDKATETVPESSTIQTASGATGTSGSDSEPSKSDNDTSEDDEGFFQKASEFIEKHKTEISAGTGTVVSVGLVGTLVQRLQLLPLCFSLKLGPRNSFGPKSVK
ncbi:hypothetical protein MACK_001755 [Theileria orientalis]|uniref:Uncharacterized protein n=1 Tax=Theileria orientalis TaxID=68886 RepID=A0A976QUU2_THEOR|nr:hypothetical protein MACK_001755 [Theileria orientalis]